MSRHKHTHKFTLEKHTKTVKHVIMPSVNHISMLPDLAILTIYKHLSFTDVVAMSKVSRRFAMISQGIEALNTELSPNQVIECVEQNETRGRSHACLVALVSKVTPTVDLNFDAPMQPLMVALSMIQKHETYRLSNNLIDHSAWHKGLRVMSLHLPWTDDCGHEPLFGLIKDLDYFPNMDQLKLFIRLSRTGIPLPGDANFREDQDPRLDMREWDGIDEKWSEIMPTIDVGDRKLSLLHLTFSKQAQRCPHWLLSPTIKAQATKRLEINSCTAMISPQLYMRELTHITARPQHVVRFIHGIIPYHIDNKYAKKVEEVEEVEGGEERHTLELNNLHTLVLASPHSSSFHKTAGMKIARALIRVKNAVPSLTHVMYVPTHDYNHGTVEVPRLVIPPILGLNLVVIEESPRVQEWFCDAYDSKWSDFGGVACRTCRDVFI